MKRLAGWVCVMASLIFFASCSDDDESGTFKLDSTALFLQAGNSATVNYSAVNIENISVSSKPEGWADPVIDPVNHTVTVVAPSTFDEKTEKTGSFYFSAKVHKGSYVSANLFVGVVHMEDLSDRPANCYLIHKKETNYLFDAMHKGDGRSELATASVEVIWQSSSKLIQHLDFKEGKVSFYIGAKEGDKEKIFEGNALIGAYDAVGKLIWSWHVWATDYDPDQAGGSVVWNTYEMMTRNLGAMASDNASSQDILASYGLYYQWGRKDPFVGPSTYQASNGTSATMYDSQGKRVKMTVEPSSSAVGTDEYAVEHPLTYITGVSDSQNDWLWKHDENRWSATQKTVNDPCPYGWQVAPVAVFDGLSIIGTPQASDYDKYGWTLANQGIESFFIGAGRRRYDNGSILNIYNPLPVSRNEALEAQPWEGLYWSGNSLPEAKGASFYFWFEKKSTTGGVKNNVPYARANGMQVRCVRVK